MVVRFGMGEGSASLASQLFIRKAHDQMRLILDEQAGGRLEVVMKLYAAKDMPRSVAWPRVSAVSAAGRGDEEAKLSFFKDLLPRAPNCKQEQMPARLMQAPALAQEMW